MSNNGPKKEQPTEKQLFMSIMRNKDINSKKLAISNFDPAQKGRFTVFYRDMQAKAEKAREIRDNIEKLEAQKAEILHQSVQAVAKDLDSIHISDAKTAEKPVVRPNF